MDRLARGTCVSLPISFWPQCPNSLGRRQIALVLIPLPEAHGRTAARTAVRDALGLIAGRLSLPREILETPSGPQFAAADHHISVSYAGDKALIGIANARRIGVDIVRVEPVAEATALSRLYLPEKERNFCDDEEFAARWARLEACCKAQRLPLTEIDPERESAYAQCELPECEQIAGYRIALAVI